MNPRLKPVILLLGATVLITLAKLLVAIWTGSLAVLATLFDSVLDLLAGFLIYAGIQQAAKPADEFHHYGRSKYEHLSSLGQTFIILVSVGIILWQALTRWMQPAHITVGPVEYGILAATIALELALVPYFKRSLKDNKSFALDATAQHFYADIRQNVVAVAALWAATQGFALADPFAALVIAYLVLKPVYRVGLKSIRELTDASPPRHTRKRIEIAILSVKDVRGFERLRARVNNGKISLDVSILLDGAMSLERAHAISHQVIRALKGQVPEIEDTVVHIKPKDTRHTHTF